MHSVSWPDTYEEWIGDCPSGVRCTVKRFAFLRSFSTKGSQALLGQQNSLVSLDSYAFPTHEKSVTLSAATTRSKMAAMKLQASEGDGDEDALSPV